MNKPSVSVVTPTRNRKEKLIRLINSILKSNYPQNKLEIIVVDDASTDGTYEEVKRKFPQIKIIRNQNQSLLAVSRNVGIRNANGENIFLIDDDNVIDKNCVSELVNVIENNYSPPIGVVAPIMYYFKQPNRIWCAGIKRNMITSLTTLIGRDEIDNSQFNELMGSIDFPNAFMIKREVTERIGGFNEQEFPIHYDEADFGERVRRAGYKIICNPKAKIWHDIPLPEEIKDKARLYHCHNKLRAYYTGRNRIIFHKKYSKIWQFLIFILVFNWFFTLYYLRLILFISEKSLTEKLKITMNYLKGVWDGIKNE